MARQRESGFRLPRVADGGDVSMWETNGRCRLISRVHYVGSSVSVSRPVGFTVVSVTPFLSFLVESRGRTTLKIYVLLLGKLEEGRSFFLDLPLLNCL